MDEEVRDYLTGDLETFGALPDLGALVVAPKATAATARAVPTEVVRQDVSVTSASSVAPATSTVVREPVRATSATEVAPSDGVVRQTAPAASAASSTAPSSGVVRGPLRLTSSASTATSDPSVRRDAPAYTSASSASGPTETAAGGGSGKPPRGPLIPEIVYGPPPGRVIDANVTLSSPAAKQSPMPWLLLAALAGGLYWLASTETSKPRLQPLLDDDTEDDDE